MRRVSLSLHFPTCVSVLVLDPKYKIEREREWTSQHEKVCCCGSCCWDLFAVLNITFHLLLTNYFVYMGTSERWDARRIVSCPFMYPRVTSRKIPEPLSYRTPFNQEIARSYLLYPQTWHGTNDGRRTYRTIVYFHVVEYKRTITTHLLILHHPCFDRISQTYIYK